MRELVAWLKRRAKNAKRIGQRVLLVDYAMRRRSGFPESANTFAREQNLSSAYVSEALMEIDKELDEIELRIFTRDETDRDRLAS